jgi:hypothetical protein
MNLEDVKKLSPLDRLCYFVRETAQHIPSSQGWQTEALDRGPHTAEPLLLQCVPRAG